MSKISKSYILGFDLNDDGHDISVASICQFNQDKGRYEMVNTLYGEEAEILYAHICSDQATYINMVSNNGRSLAKRIINQIYGLKE